jgi:hypothetical protein
MAWSQRQVPGADDDVPLIQYLLRTTETKLRVLSEQNWQRVTCKDT